MNIPVSVMFRPMPLATPRSPSRNTGNALSNRPTVLGLPTGVFSVRLDIGAGAPLAGCLTVGVPQLPVKKRALSRWTGKRLTLEGEREAMKGHVGAVLTSGLAAIALALALLQVFVLAHASPRQASAQAMGPGGTSNRYSV